MTVDNPNIDALKKTYNHFVEENDVLRSRVFLTVKGLRQCIDEYKEVDIPVINTTKNNLNKEMRALKNIKGIFSGKPLCFGYIFLYDNKATLFVTVHHLVFDGYSVGLAFKELCEYYDAFISNKEPSKLIKKYTIENYYEDYQKELKSEKHKQNRKWWKEKINSRKDFKVVVPIANSKSKVRHKIVNIEGEKYIQLTKLCEEYQIPLNFVITCISALTIYKIKGANDFCFGELQHGRSMFVRKQLIGDLASMFINFYHIDENDTTKQFFKDSYTDYLECMRHLGVNVFEKLIDTLKTELRILRFNYYGIIFSNLNVVDYGGGSEFRYECSGISANYQPNQFYILVTDNHKNSVMIDVMHQSKIIKPEKMDLYCKTFKEIFENIVIDPNKKIKEIL